MPTKSLVEVVHWLEEIFDRNGVQRSYGGAIARNFYAPPRLTRDVDVLVLISQLKLPGVVDDMVAGGALGVSKDGTTRPLDLKTFMEDLRSKGWMTVVELEGVKVEIFAPWHPFDSAVLMRAQARDFGGRVIESTRLKI